MTSAKSTLNVALSRETETCWHPLPDDFGQYVPWAYNQMEGESIVIVKVMQLDYKNASNSTQRSKVKNKRSKVMPSPSSEDKSATWGSTLMGTDHVIRILTTYDRSDSLIHIKFDMNAKIPRKIMKVISLILEFHTHLIGVTINRGLDMYTVHELKNWLTLSGITDICLDDTFVVEGNYHILLENQNLLKNLSLARCKINDKVVQNIASKLLHPLPASKTLAVLNLSSNRITDIGATHLSEALRSNRRLYYLNLAGNMICDQGASKILNVITEFPLHAHELLNVRAEHINYLKQKIQLSKRILKDLKAADDDRKLAKKKIVKAPPKLKGTEKEISVKGLLEGDTKSLGDVEATMLRDRADAMAINMLGRFDGPFILKNTKIIDGTTYCLGNNVLCYLNLAYNNLSYVSIKKLLNVVLSQKLLDRKPRGLISVCIEGNNIPVKSAELANIDEILQSGLNQFSGRQTTQRRKSVSRASNK